MTTLPNTTRDESTNAGDRPGLREVLCGHCRNSNGSDRRFCSACGKPLWEMCLKCGAECSSSERFCGGCGANRQDAFQERLDQLEETLAQVAALEQQHLFDKAMRLLKSLDVPRDAKFEHLRAELPTRMEALRRQLEEQGDHLHEGASRAKELLAKFAYREAEAFLRNLPAGLRTPETDSLLETAGTAVRELGTLRDEIAAAVQSKQYLELAPKINRLLALKPTSQDARKIAQHVRAQLLQAAKKQLQFHEYRKAADLLQRIPDCAEDETVVKFRRLATELHWMYDDLAQAPIVDPPVLQIAKRLRERVPTDEATVALCRKIAERAHGKADEARFPFLSWAPTPRRTWLGCDVRWLAGSERIRLMDPKAGEVWGKHPGRFFVATGLALQGVGLATINTNLHTPSGLLSRIGLGARSEAGPSAWGLDVGESALKAVRLVIQPGQTEAHLDRCAVYPYRLSLNRPEAEGSRAALIGESLAAFAAEHAPDSRDRICVSLPGSRVLIRFVQLPDVPRGKKLSEMVKYEAQQRIPVPLDELAWDYHVLNPAQQRAPSATQSSVWERDWKQVLLLAAKQIETQELSRVFAQAKVPLQTLQSDCIALHNFALHEQLEHISAGGRDDKSLGLLDVGGAATNILILSEGKPWFRSIRFGGDDFTTTIVRKLTLTHDQAERVKHEPTLLKTIHPLYDALDPSFNRLGEEIRRSLHAFTQETGRKVTVLLGTGGGFAAHRLLRHLSSGPTGPHVLKQPPAE